jgi:hypothetical protein
LNNGVKYVVIRPILACWEVLAEWAATNKAIERGNRVPYLSDFIHLIEVWNLLGPQGEAVVKFWKNLPEWIVPIGVENQDVYHRYLCFQVQQIFYYLILKSKEPHYSWLQDPNKDLFKIFREKVAGIW